jgi:acetyl-CoA synthetase
MAADKTAPIEHVEHLLREERVFRPPASLALEANATPRELEKARTLAKRDFLAYWEDAALELDWFRRWDTVLDDANAPFYRWFDGGRCNIVYNALDRHITTVSKNKLALVWEAETGETRKFTYYELYREVNRLANGLRSLGAARGDRIVICMPMIPETVVAMLAAAKIGAIHAVVFPGFSAKMLRKRITDAGARYVVTADGFYRNGRVINLKKLVDEALEQGCASVESVVVARRASVEMDMAPGRDIWMHDLVRQQPSEAACEVMDAEDTLFLLYTSGATGEPKGIVHTHGGYMVGVQRTFRWIFDVKPTDIYWCTADIGWITGHSYVVYGPLMTGATVVLYEGHPLYPQADRLWHTVARHGVTTLYTTPTLVRMLMRYGASYPRRHDLSTLRLLGSVGEPISSEAWIWLREHAGRGEAPIMDTWWQTETGMVMISPVPAALTKPGSVGRPLPGVEADVVDKSGRSVPPGKGGFLVLTKPWPAMLRSVWGDPQRYMAEYWERIPGPDGGLVYTTGDVARKDDDGYYWVQGRADDVINIAGHRLGAAELESALASHPAVAEAAMVGVPDTIRGQVAKGYVILHEGHQASEALNEELVEHVRAELGPIVVIKGVEFVDALPRTRSGKIMRRMLAAKELGVDPGDISSLDEDG